MSDKIRTQAPAAMTADDKILKLLNDGFSRIEDRFDGMREDFAKHWDRIKAKLDAATARLRESNEESRRKYGPPAD